MGDRKKSYSEEAKVKAEISYNLYQIKKTKDKKSDATKKSVNQLARIVGVSRKTFYNYVN